MNKSHPFTNDRRQERMPHCQSEGEIQYLLRAEEQILRSISARAPISGILDEICKALDCQLGNMVTLITLPGDDASELAEIATNAALFGLFAFCSEGVVAEDDELLGFLEMYCCDDRSPSSRELQLIERAGCLAGLAIKCENQASHHANGRVPENLSVRGNFRAGLVYVN